MKKIDKILVETPEDARITQSDLHGLLDYDPKDGTFRWKWRPGKGARRSGSVAGCVSAKGYWRIKLLGKSYAAHRLACIYTNGSIPDGMQIDHINGVKDDNRIANLRLATNSQNAGNKPISQRNRHGVRGVWIEPTTGKWRSVIEVNGQRFSLGLFHTKEQAGAAYQEAERKHRGEFACQI